MPGDLGTITVHATYEDLSGNPITGSVSFVASTTLLDPNSDLIFVPKNFSATLDSSGHFSIVLPATDDPDISPIGWTYQVTENFPHGRQFNIQVPSSAVGGQISLAALAPAVPSSGLQSFVLLSTFENLQNQVNGLTTGNSNRAAALALVLGG